VISLEIEQSSLHIRTVHTIVIQYTPIHCTVSLARHDALDVTDPLVRLPKTEGSISNDRPCCICSQFWLNRQSSAI